MSPALQLCRFSWFAEPIFDQEELKRDAREENGYFREKIISFYTTNFSYFNIHSKISKKSIKVKIEHPSIIDKRLPTITETTKLFDHMAGNLLFLLQR